MKISINGSSEAIFPNLDTLRSHARKASEDGFTGWWLAQVGVTDALTVITAVADSAPGIEMGTAVIPTWPRHPSMLAAQALTTQAAIGGRLQLGIGLGHKPQVEDGWGMEWDRPVRHLIDYLEILNSLMNTGHANYKGEKFTLINQPAARITEEAPALLIAALGEQVLRVAGKRADGTILWMVGEKTIKEHIAPRIQDAAAEADRPSPRIVCSLPVCITDDTAPVRAFADEVLEIYGVLPSYRAMLDREGAAGPSDVSLFGSEEQVGERIAALKAAGTTEFAALEFGLNDVDLARTRAFLKTLM